MTPSASAEHCVAYADVDRLHVGERKSRHARRRRGHRAHRRDDSRQSARRRHRLAHFGRSLRTVLAGYIDSSRAPLLGPPVQRRSQAPSSRHDGKSIELSISFGLAEVPNTRFRCRTRSPRPRSPARPPRIAGAVASRLYQEADRSIVRRYEDVTIVGQSARGDRERSFPHGGAADRADGPATVRRAASSCCCA